MITPFKNKRSRLTLQGIILLLIIPLLMDRAQAGTWTESELSNLVKQAYIYGFPVYEMYRTRYEAVYKPNNPKHADINRFYNERKLADHTFRDFTTPNNDTPYSSAWLDLKAEPVVISVPDTGGRYYVLALMDFFTNNFAYIGRRVTGTQKGDYFVVGPDWKGVIPPGVSLIKSPQDSVWILGRTLVDGEVDLINVHKIQDQYKITPLSVWLKGTGEIKTARPAGSPPDPKDPWDFWKIVNLGLTENPPPANESILADLAKIGIGPGQTFRPERFTPEESKTILKSMQTAMQEIATSRVRFVKIQEGWSITPPNIGNFGTDYGYRALIALMGLGALEPAEATYMTAVTDKDGKALSGEFCYRLHFNKGDIPPVDAFWSLSMYEVMKDMRGFFTANPINRYSIGDRTKGLKYNPDGTLDIYIQHQSPGKDLEDNWLPAPKGIFRVTLRMYQPREIVLTGKYRLPGLKRID
jgi:hypothetical protein